MKRLFFFLTLVTTSICTYAQKSAFGIKGGVNVAKMSAPSDGYKTLVSGHFGLLDHIHINRMFAVQPEVIYSMQGTKYKFDNNDYEYRLGYLNIPVLLQIMTQKGWRFETGPQLGIILNATNNRVNPQDVKGVFKSTDVAWALGIGYITASKFGFDVRYNIGLSDITKDSNTDIKNMVLQAGIFYQFH